MVPLTLAVLLIAALPDVSADPASLKIGAEDIRKAEALVPKLGDDRFAVRDAADRELREMGRRAMPVLVKSARTALDPEIRVRSERLLVRAAADDFNVRLATFLADTGAKYEHALPGWTQFREAAGNSAEARELFADMMRSEANREVVAGLALSKEELVRRVLARRQELYAKMYPTALAIGGGPRVSVERYDPPLVDTVTMVFADIVTGDKDGARMVGARSMTTATLMSRPGAWRSGLAASSDGSAVRELFVKWVDTREAPLSLYQAMNTASQMSGMKDVALRTAKKLLKIDAGVTPLYQANAITMVARLGGKDELPTVVSHLSNEAVIRQAIGGQEEIQLRDVALAVALLLTDRQPHEFGYVTGNGDNINLASFSYYNCRFPDPADRDKAFARWAELEPKLVPVKKK